MTLDHLFEQLSNLSRLEKLRAIQFLADELAEEEGEPPLISGAEYHIYTPLGNEAAAQTLWDVLHTATNFSSADQM